MKIDVTTIGPGTAYPETSMLRFVYVGHSGMADLHLDERHGPHHMKWVYSGDGVGNGLICHEWDHPPERWLKLSREWR